MTESKDSKQDFVVTEANTVILDFKNHSYHASLLGSKTFLFGY